MRGGVHALAALAASCACSGTSGTIEVSLTTAPASTILDGVDTLRVTITDPPSVTTAARGSDGFDLFVSFDAVETSGEIIVEGLDGSGTTIAVGQTPPFPLDAVTADVVVYMAAPRTFAAAPLALDTALSGVTVVPLTYGGLLAGGRDATGSASSDLGVYNAFDHSFTAGLPLPAPRSDMAGGVGTSGLVYLFGGNDDAGSATSSLLRFDTTVSPNGAYTGSNTFAGFERAGQSMQVDGIETFVISGMPALDLIGDDASGSDTISARTDLPFAPPQGASVVGSDDTQIVVFAGSGAGSSGCVRLHSSVVDALAIAGAARTAHAMIALANGKVAIVGGALAGTPTLDAVIIDATAGTATTTTGALSTARLGAAAATTSRYVIVAGGSDGSGGVVETADILDATTLALIATIPMVVGRTGAAALALPNDQVLVVGGLDATGMPSDLIELFTPDAPPTN